MLWFLLVLAAAVPSPASSSPASSGDLRTDPIVGSTIFLHADTLEPLREPVVVPDSWRVSPPEGYDYYLVLLQAPASRDARMRLRAKGADLIDYIPYNSYLVRIPTGATEEILEDEAVVWWSLWHPWFKLHPRLRDRSDAVELNVVLHPGESDQAVRAWLGQRGCESASMLMAPDQRAVRVTVQASLLSGIAFRREVQWIEENLPARTFNQNAQWVTQSFIANTRPIWDAGITGTGQIIEINDTGCRTTHVAFVDPAVPINDFGVYLTHRKIVAYLDGTPFGNGLFGDEYDPYPPYGHGTHVSCSAAGDDGTYTLKDGMAKTAKLVITDVGVASGLNTSMPYQMFSNARQYGARIHNCSWGQDTEGQYNSYDSSCDSYMWWQPYEVVSVAAGNNPPNTIVGSPACAKSILCVGASRNGTNGDRYASWSADGPTADGRMAPTFITPGEGVSSASNASDVGYASSDGTSMAAPIAAGCAALVRSYYMDGYYPTGTANPSHAFMPLNSLIKATLVAATRDPQFFSPPNNQTGWGFVVLDDALYFPGRSRTMWVYQDTVGMVEGASQSWSITASAGGELKIVLCWSDKPGSLGGTGPKIKNDLDLIVTGPGGTYRGNWFSGGQSVPGGSADRLNTTEVVWLRSPQTGTYTITVEYYASVQDDIQRFSIVAVGENVAPVGGDTEPPTAPSNLQLGSNGILTWSPSTDNVGVAGYRIYRSTTAYFEVSGGMTPLGTTTSTSFNVAGSLGNPNVNYSFRVTAYDEALNESAPSNTVGEHDYLLDDGP